ncbi:OmpA family protein [Sphingomonas montanisoli]|uniref:OmpA family protein n=1 Tax=Sphingomonas montanisoli TaxID=2606412 RepID=A0A5D9C321_9SPHN|nr:OmpA family protein [Sphingomonas montanisoli]TZG26069.1 OmpA family protein [Sphingomonas montanisoli]
MRIKLVAPLVLIAFAAAPLGAQQAQYSVEDIQKSFAVDCSSVDPANPPAECAVDEAPAKGPRTSATRGFSVGRTNNKGVGVTPGGNPAAAAKPVKKTYAAPKPLPPARKDLLITFENASSALTAQAMANIRVFAKALQTPALSSMRFAIDGHTNAVGNREYNIQLSKERAQAVASLLGDLGIAPSRLEVNGWGFDKPANPSDPAGAANRRVEARRL